MTIPLVILAAFSMLLGLIGTPAWPWFTFVSQWSASEAWIFRGFAENGVLPVMLSSTVIVFLGLGPRLVVLRTQTNRKCDSPGCGGAASTANLQCAA